MVRKDIKQFLKTIPQNVTLVAATKYVDIDDMKILLDGNTISPARKVTFVRLRSSFP